MGLFSDTSLLPPTNFMPPLSGLLGQQMAALPPFGMASGGNGTQFQPTQPLQLPPIGPPSGPPGGLVPMGGGPGGSFEGGQQPSLAPGGPIGPGGVPPLAGPPGAVFMAPRRPNHGVEGRPIVLRANHFAVRIPGGIIQHYAIDVQPDKCPRRVNRSVSFFLLLPVAPLIPPSFSVRLLTR